MGVGDGEVRSAALGGIEAHHHRLEQRPTRERASRGCNSSRAEAEEAAASCFPLPARARSPPSRAHARTEWRSCNGAVSVSSLSSTLPFHVPHSAHAARVLTHPPHRCLLFHRRPSRYLADRLARQARRTHRGVQEFRHGRVRSVPARVTPQPFHLHPRLRLFLVPFQLAFRSEFAHLRSRLEKIPSRTRSSVAASSYNSRANPARRRACATAAWTVSREIRKRNARFSASASPPSFASADARAASRNAGPTTSSPRETHARRRSRTVAERGIAREHEKVHLRFRIRVAQHDDIVVVRQNAEFSRWVRRDVQWKPPAGRAFGFALVSDVLVLVSGVVAAAVFAARIIAANAFGGGELDRGGDDVGGGGGPDRFRALSGPPFSPRRIVRLAARPWARRMSSRRRRRRRRRDTRGRDRTLPLGSVARSPSDPSFASPRRRPSRR